MDALSVMERLEALPLDALQAEIKGAETETLTALATAHLKELKESLEIAELNALLNVDYGEKSNAETRKRLEKAAVAESLEVQALRSGVAEEETNIARKAGEAAQAKAKRYAIKFELDSLKEIAGLMRERMALERAKLDRETALAHVELAKIQETVMKELQGVKTNG